MYILQDILKDNYAKWYDRDFVFTKKNGIYSPTTFGQLIENSIYLAEALAERNLKGKRFIIYGENSVEWMQADIAIMGYLGLSIGIDKEWKLQDVINTVSFLEADVLIYSESKSDIAAAVKKQFPKLLCFSMQNDFPALVEEGKEISSKRSCIFDLEENDRTKPVKVVFSSGTTSFPKAVMLTQQNIFSGYEPLMRRAPFTLEDKIYLFLPLHHTYAGVYNFVLSLISGVQIYLSTGVANLMPELEEVQPTILCVVPLILMRMYAAVNGANEKLKYLLGGKMKYLFTGGAKLEREVKKAYKAEGINVLEAYALSETASSFAIEYSNQKHLDSVGTIFENLDVRVFEPDENGTGEIICKGEAVFAGYMNNEEATRQAMDENGYFHTGDLGFIKDAELFITGRKKRMILLSNGENIYPDNIEKKILAKDGNINSVKVFLNNSVLKANIYLKAPCETDYFKLIEDLNQESSKHEKVSEVEVFIDSVDVRLKQ